MNVSGSAGGRRNLVDAVTACLAGQATGGAVLYGDAGIGKSTVADEVVRNLGDTVRVQRARAEPTLAQVPYGALFPYLRGVTPAELESPLAVLRTVRSSLAKGPAGDARPLLLIVDDVHDLDDASSHLLAQLVMARSLKILALCRSWSAQPRELLELCQDGILEAFEVSPLTTAEVRNALEQMFGGTVAGGTVLMLQHKSLGNPHLLKALAAHAAAAGNVVQHHGVWRMIREPTGLDPGTTDLFKGLVNGLEASQRRVVDIAALAGSVPAAAAGALFDSTAVRSLEEMGLLADMRTGNLAVRLRFPPYADVIRSMVPAGCSGELLNQFLDVMNRLEPAPERARVELVRWQVDAGRPPSPEESLRAACAANDECDHPLALRLADAGTNSQPAALVERARAHWGLGDSSEAKTALDLIHENVDHRTIAAAALLRASLVEPEAGYRAQLEKISSGWMEAAGAQSSTAPGDAPVAVAACLDAATGAWLLQAYAHMLEGDFGTALDRLANAPAPGPEDAGVTRLLAGTVKALCLAETGRFRQAAEAGTEALKLVAATPSLRAFYPFVFSRNVESLLIAGRYQEAERALDEYSRTAPCRHRWFSGNESALRGLLLFRRGRMKPAVQSLAEGIGPLRHEDQGMLLPSVLGAAAAGAALLGNGGQAKDFRIGLQEEAGAGSRPRLLVASAYAAAAAINREGPPGTAGPNPVFLLDELQACAATASAAGWVSAEKEILEHQLLLGDGSGAARLAELCAPLDGPETQALAAVASSRASSDPGGLMAAAEVATRAGKDLLAATAMSWASGIYERQGLQRQHNGALHQLRVTLRRLDGVTTPATERARGSAPALTAREQQIVLLVRRGASNKQIAESLTLSPRTAEGHLYRIYRKLGVENRQQLIRYAEVLDQ